MRNVVRQINFRSIIAIVFVLFAWITCPTFTRAQSNSNTKTKTETAIRAVLDAQAVAWNRGDIEGYMDGYDRSANTEFVTGDRINRGWQAVLDRYKKAYDTREKMGVLTFSDLEINVL